MRQMRQQIEVGFGIAVGVCLALSGSMAFADTTPPPAYQEVYDLLRTNLPGLDEPTLQRAAVEGLLSRFSGRASISGTNASELKRGILQPAQIRVIDERFAYIRLSGVDSVLVTDLEKALGDLAKTNRLQGGVLDLRFAKGSDYAAAYGAASLWVTGTQLLLDWGDGPRKSAGVTPAGRIPWVVLVNSETAGSPEALAASLRQTDSALLVGSRTAGQAAISREFPLQNGQQLLIATLPVKTGDGKAISPAGLTPDIEVKVDLEQERGFLEYSSSKTGGKGVASSPEPLRRGSISGSAATNRPARRRINEADLVRMQKEGKQRSDVDLSSGNGDGVGADVATGSLDPALARALDLLKGLAVVRQSRGE